MAKKSKDKEIAELKEKLVMYQEFLEVANKRNAELISAEERSFMFSKTYLLMKDRIEWLECLKRLSDVEYKGLEKKVQILTTELKQRELDITERDAEIRRLQEIFSEEKFDK